MKTHRACTYWYQISIYADHKRDGVRTQTTIRIPVRCEKAGEYASTCTYINPSSASIETKDLPNDQLFDSAVGPELKR